MAGDWIKIEHALPDKPEVMQMASILDIDADAVVGKLIRVWLWFDTHTNNGTAPVTVQALLNRYTCVTGFVDAMEKVGWISIDNERLSIVGFDRHNGTSAKARANCNRRVAKSREKKNKSVTPPLQKALPEKRREEKIAETSKDVAAVPQHLAAAEIDHEDLSIMLDSLVHHYPRHTHYADTLKSAKACLLRHATQYQGIQGSYEAILAGTKQIAAVISKWPENEQIRFAKQPPQFFDGDHWRDDPKYWLSHKALPGEPMANLGGRRPFNKISL